MKLISLIILFPAWSLISCHANTPAIEGNLPKHEKTIRQIVADKFPDGNVYFGVSSHFSLFGTKTMDIVDREFSYVTPANDFKQTYIHPEPGKYEYEKSDAWVKHCRENKQVIRMHSPISPQCSKWAKTDSRTAEELETMLEEYMTTLCKRYNGTPEILWMDVVNETIDKTTSGWFGPKPGTDEWENPWTIIGFDETHQLRPPLYIKQAFTIANKYAPDIKLIINQHGALEKASWEKMKALVVYLRENNLRVDGIGWQAHIDLGWEKIPGNLEYLTEIINWCRTNKLDFHITEFNVWLKNENAGKLEEQANTFTSIVKTILDNRKDITIGIDFWQVRGSETMNKEWNGCLFDEELKPKPAYYKLKELLENY